MINVMDLAEQDTRLQKVSISEFAGPCPNPGCARQTDGFRVRPEKNQFGDAEPKGGFMCRGCWDPHQPPIRPERPRWGDAIDYLMHVRKLSFAAARAFLEEQEGRIVHRPVVQTGQRLDYHSPLWQERTHALMLEARERLWSPQDTLALEYARSRGLLDVTIRQARLGYSRHNDIPRLLIPLYNRGFYGTVYRRDLRPGIASGQRWRDAPGGGKSELYLADVLRRHVPTLLTEAALDALSLAQECGDFVNAVATGGVSSGKLSHWVVVLSVLPLVLVAFDADASGDKEADWWLERLPNARRLRPRFHDVNNMLLAGVDLRGWVTRAVVENRALSGDDGAELADVCWSCRRPLSADDRVFHYSETGVCYCERHPYPPAPTRVRKVASVPVSAPEPVRQPASVYAGQHVSATQRAYIACCVPTPLQYR